MLSELNWNSKSPFVEEHEESLCLDTTPHSAKNYQKPPVGSNDDKALPLPPPTESPRGGSRRALEGHRRHKSSYRPHR